MMSEVVDIINAQIIQHTSDCRSTLRAASKSLAPIKWAT